MAQFKSPVDSEAISTQTPCDSDLTQQDGWVAPVCTLTDGGLRLGMCSQVSIKPPLPTPDKTRRRAAFLRILPKQAVIVLM